MIPRFYSKKEIERRKEIFTRVWNLENIGRPAFQLWKDGPSYSTRSRIENPELFLQSQIEGLKARSEYICDGPPFLYPYAGVVVIPSAFGCEVVMSETAEPEALPIIDKPEDVYKLKKPKPNDGLMKVVLEQLKYLKDKNNGYYDIRMHDLQGPFSAASLIWGLEEFLVALYSSPEEVHYLLKLVTEYIIDIVEAQREVVPDLILAHCVPDWMPRGFGITISDDLAAVVSPAIYEEFALPYNNIISDYYGGVFIHSCGNSSANYDTVLKHRNFRGLNFEAGENPYALALEKLGKKSLIAPHPGLNLKSAYGNSLGYTKYLLENTPMGIPYIITLWESVFNPETGKYEKDLSIDEAMDLLNFISRRNRQ